MCFARLHIRKCENGFRISEKRRKGPKTHFSLLAYVVTSEKFKCLLGALKCVLRDLRFFCFSDRGMKKRKKNRCQSGEGSSISKSEQGQRIV
jgi:hypothetical protein